MSELETRIDRLESLDSIRQLPAKYALTLDMRDIDMMVTLFPENVRVGKDASGRKALRAYMDRTLRSPFTGTSHHIGGHIIEFDDPDHAHGIVYSKNEHETPIEGGDDEWVIMQMMYVDNYVRQDGRWYFERRLPLYWYATDLNKPPVGDNKMRWPNSEATEGNFHKLFPSFAEYWERDGDHDGPVPEPAPLEGFLNAMRRGQAAPKVKVRAD
ncbi:nuclear transport factor 2 family protein [Parasphingorhabdus halotolerans]|uniref:Nuclear transport factor 2 family protein n=1 Tax=Parasphingorhabdus halotolerans TaxID=2725558 RepID=A0A6H2DM12_9SPHN|nr:nuclear transport factor 2 family protein [Parasphingorhabdus halotolerans]QJB68791.1 nuclear transport factor 2 family protein [Parasphingorhabdus halotolerans]